jgi:plastocyanin
VFLLLAFAPSTVNMRATTLTTAALLTLASHASAKTIQIDVGENGFTFTPDSVTASVNDILSFHFHPLNHSVVMGDFANPCAPAKTGAFFSGFMPVSSGEAVCIKILHLDAFFYKLISRLERGFPSHRQLDRPHLLLLFTEHSFSLH